MTVETAADKNSIPSDNRPQVMFLARSLDRGGAERQLIALLSGLRDKGWNVSVACFYGGAALQEEITDKGITCYDLGKKGRWDIPAFLSRLYRLIRRTKPDIIHGYMPMPNLLALLAGRMATQCCVVWGVRASNMQLNRYDWLSTVVFKAECVFAKRANLTISNSRAGAEYRIAHGFPAKRMAIIPNGIDTDRFRYDASGRGKVRKEWGIDESDILIGMVARLDPMKDHITFLNMVSKLAASDPRLRFACIGSGMGDWAAKLRSHERSLGLVGRIIWAGPRNDMRAIYSALDVNVLCSAFGEGFSNAVGEAMACGRVCVVTDVGDMADAVADVGLIVPAGDAKALSQEVRNAVDGLAAPMRFSAEDIRARIVDRYSISALVDLSAQTLQYAWNDTK